MKNETPCHWVDAQVTAWCLGELAPEAAERVRQHLAACPACRAAADATAQALAQLRDSLAPETAAPAPVLDTARRQHIRAARARHQRALPLRRLVGTAVAEPSPRRWTPLLLRMAATVAVLLALAAALLPARQRQRRHATPPAGPVPPVSLAYRPAERDRDGEQRARADAAAATGSGREAVPPERTREEAAAAKAPSSPAPEPDAASRLGGGAATPPPGVAYGSAAEAAPAPPRPAKPAPAAKPKLAPAPGQAGAHARLSDAQTASGGARGAATSGSTNGNALIVMTAPDAATGTTEAERKSADALAPPEPPAAVPAPAALAAAVHVPATKRAVAPPLPSPAEVGVEAFVNAFDYDYEPPGDGALAVHALAAPSPFRPGRVLLRIGIRAAPAAAAAPAPGTVSIRLEFATARVLRHRRVGSDTWLPGAQPLLHTIQARAAAQAWTVLCEVEPGASGPAPVGVLRVRWQDALTGRTEEREQALGAGTWQGSLAAAPGSFRLAAGAAEFAERQQRLAAAAVPAAGEDDHLLALLRQAARERPADAHVQLLLRRAEAAPTPPAP
jgi:hypothetical protein